MISGKDLGVLWATMVHEPQNNQSAAELTAK